jgi:hypothetical protein
MQCGRCARVVERGNIAIKYASGCVSGRSLFEVASFTHIYKGLRQGTSTAMSVGRWCSSLALVIRYLFER